MQNRRDHPGGQGTIDFPGVSLLEYAGGGKWKREEDFWAWKQREVAMKAYEDASRQFDPEHAKKKTRWNWGNGPEWTRGGRSAHERPPRVHSGPLPQFQRVFFFACSGSYCRLASS